MPVTESQRSTYQSELNTLQGKSALIRKLNATRKPTRLSCVLLLRVIWDNRSGHRRTPPPSARVPGQTGNMLACTL
jgi:hypothetical protein